MSKLRHQRHDDGTVFVALSSDYGPIGSTRVSDAEARRFAWAVLSDLDEVSEDELLAAPHNEEIAVIQRLFGLRPAEAKILQLLMRHAGKTVLRHALYDIVVVGENTATKIMDVYIHRLRKVLNDSGERGVIRTVFGQGYTMDLEPAKRISERVGRRRFDLALKTIDGSALISLPEPFAGVRLVPAHRVVK